MISRPTGRGGGLGHAPEQPGRTIHFNIGGQLLADRFTAQGASHRRQAFHVIGEVETQLKREPFERRRLELRDFVFVGPDSPETGLIFLVLCVGGDQVAVMPLLDEGRTALRRDAGRERRPARPAGSSSPAHSLPSARPGRWRRSFTNEQLAPRFDPKT